MKKILLLLLLLSIILTGCLRGIGQELSNNSDVFSKNGNFKDSIDFKWFKKMGYFFSVSDGHTVINQLLPSTDLQSVIDHAVDDVLNKGILAAAVAESQGDKEMTIRVNVSRLNTTTDGICLRIRLQLHEHKEPIAEEYQNFRLYRYDSNTKKYSMIMENMMEDDVLKWRPKY
jgi:hypothetical protein